MPIKPIRLFNNPQKGIATHPLLGIGLIRNLDIKSNPGSMKLNLKTIAATQTTNGNGFVGQVTGIVRDKTISVGYLYAVDDTNIVYRSIDNGVTWTIIGDGTGGTSQNGTGSGQGIEIWKNYLWVVGGHIDCYGPLDSSPAWTKNFTGGGQFTIAGTNSFPYDPTFSSIDGCLYICNQNQVNKLQEATAPFAPGTSGSYTAIGNAITLATQYNISSIEDLGQFLMLGTKLTADSSSVYEQGADIFPYDRSTLVLGVPIKVPERGIQQMISVGNRLYFFAGLKGNFYLCDTVTYQKIAELPNYVNNQDANPLFFYPKAIININDKIYMGIGGGGTTGNGNLGVWSYNINSKAFQLENTISTGGDGSANSIYISSLCPIGLKQFLIGWRDVNVSLYGIDYFSTSRYTSYSGYTDSELVNIAEALEFGDIGYLVFSLLKPLVSGQGIKIQWRKDLTSGWTTLKTYDFATNGAIQGEKISAISLKTLIYLQIRLLLTSADGTSPEVGNFYIFPND